MLDDLSIDIPTRNAWIRRPPEIILNYVTYVCTLVIGTDSIVNPLSKEICTLSQLSYNFLSQKNETNKFFNIANKYVRYKNRRRSVASHSWFPKLYQRDR